MTILFLLSLLDQLRKYPNFWAHSVFTSLTMLFCSISHDEIQFIESFQISALPYDLLLPVACSRSVVVPLSKIDFKNLACFFSLSWKPAASMGKGFGLPAGSWETCCMFYPATPPERQPTIRGVPRGASLQPHTQPSTEIWWVQLIAAKPVPDQWYLLKWSIDYKN